MSPVAAGGVVAYQHRIILRDGFGEWRECSKDQHDFIRMTGSYNGPGGASCETRALVLSSDLESCQQKFEALEFSYDEMCSTASQACAELSAARDALTAAQAEADRLRVDADRYVWLRTNADYVMISWDDAHSLEGPIFFDDALIDAAIHAAKTEQERGE